MSAIFRRVVDLVSQVINTLAVGNGGTGATTLTSNGVLLGNGTSAVTATPADATTTHVLKGGSPPSFAAIAAGDLPAASDVAAGSVTYEKAVTSSYTTSGARTGDTCNFKYVRVGNIVTVSFEDCAHNTCANATWQGLTLPVGYRPTQASGVYAIISNYDNGVLTSGLVIITTAGVMTVYANAAAAAFQATAGNICGYNAFSVSFTVN